MIEFFAPNFFKTPKTRPMKPLKNHLAIFLALLLLTVTTHLAPCQDLYRLRSGNIAAPVPAPHLQNWLNAQEHSMEDFFEVDVSFSTFDDGQNPNAYALWTEPGDGKVVFGESLLLHYLIEGESGKWSILSIMAHEYGHILQRERGIELEGRALELHADFLAGYYLGKMLPGSLREQARSVMAASFFDFGDYWRSSPGHHGTPQERMLVALEGFSRSNMCLEEAFDFGADFARYR